MDIVRVSRLVGFATDATGVGGHIKVLTLYVVVEVGGFSRVSAHQAVPFARQGGVARHLRSDQVFSF